MGGAIISYRGVVSSLYLVSELSGYQEGGGLADDWLRVETSRPRIPEAETLP